MLLLTEKCKKYNWKELNSFQKIVEVAIQKSYIKKWRLKFYLETEDEYAYRKLKLIAKVLNEGWVPNYNDSNERKWYCWFSVSSGFAFTDSHDEYGNTFTHIGSRLCFKTQEISDFAGRTFLNEYKQFMM